MKTSELAVILKSAEDLGHKDLRILWEDGRDGHSELIAVTCRLKNIGVQMDPEVALVIRRSNE